MLRDLLLEVEEQLKVKNAFALKCFQKGKSLEDIREILTLIGIENEDVFQLYTWRDGIVYNNEMHIGEYDFFSFGFMLSLKDAIEHYRLAQSEKLWSKHMFPLFANGGGDFILFDSNSNNKTTEMLFLYSPSLLLSGKPMTIYDSLEKFFRTIKKCYEKRAYSCSENGTLEVNYDLEQQVSMEENLRPIYWRE